MYIRENIYVHGILLVVYEHYFQVIHISAGICFHKRQECKNMYRTNIDTFRCSVCLFVCLLSQLSGRHGSGFV